MTRSEGRALRDRIETEGGLHGDLYSRIDEGLVPLRMEAPDPNQGLRVVGFTDGLDELSVAAMRHTPRPTQTRASGEHAALDAARTRARALADD